MASHTYKLLTGSHHLPNGQVVHAVPTWVGPSDGRDVFSSDDDLTRLNNVGMAPRFQLLSGAADKLGDPKK